MERLTEWTGEEWIARQKRLNGKIIGNKTCLAKQAAYEDTGLMLEKVQKGRRKNEKESTHIFYF